MSSVILKWEHNAIFCPPQVPALHIFYMYIHSYNFKALKFKIKWNLEFHLPFYSCWLLYWFIMAENCIGIWYGICYTFFAWFSTLSKIIVKLINNYSKLISWKRRHFWKCWVWKLPWLFSSWRTSWSRSVVSCVISSWSLSRSDSTVFVLELNNR
jgi:hypothetical protein